MGFVPDHPPDAIQVVALVDDQARVPVAPKVMIVGVATMDTVGAVIAKAAVVGKTTIAARNINLITF